MIEFQNLKQEDPYLIILKKYKYALDSGQKNIEAMSLSSYNINKNEVDSRFVNLKFINEDEFIFFSNYKSPKSIAFKSHNQISVCIYWPVINFQIRMRAKIKKTSSEYNDKYFKKRSINKNALAISSNQSQVISSYDQVIKKYEKVKDNKNLSKCPDYWGGYSFKPYEIEFWEGSDFRLNKRDLYELKNYKWIHSILEP